MSWFSSLWKGITNFFKSIVHAVCNFLSAIWPYIQWVIVACVIICLICFAFPAVGLAVGVTISSGWAMALIVGVGFMLAPDQIVEVLTGIIEAVGEVVEAVVETAVEVLSTGLSALLSNPLVLAAGALALYLIFGRDDEGPSSLTQQPQAVLV